MFRKAKVRLFNQLTSQLIPSKNVICRSEQSIVVAAQLRRHDTHAPLLCAAKYYPVNNIFNPTGIDHERSMHQLLATSPNAPATGIIPYFGTYLIPRHQEDKTLTTYLAMARYDATLDDCSSEIKSLRTTNKHLFHLVLFHVLESIVQALTRLSNYEILLNDITPNNIGLYEESWCFLNFSKSKRYAEFYDPNAPIRGGTPRYMAPERCAHDRGFPFANDIWSLGQIFKELMEQDILFHEMISQMRLADSMHRKAVLYAKHRANYPYKGSQWDTDYQTQLLTTIHHATSFEEGFQRLINSMYHTLPEYRPSLSTLQLSFQHFGTLFSFRESDITIYKQFINSLTAAPHESSLTGKISR